MTPENAIQFVRDIINRELPSGYRMILFGSFAQGKAGPTSDIDIGILGKKPVPNKLMVRIRAKVDAIPTLRKIDVVDLQTADSRFRDHAMKHAKPL